MIRVVKEGCVGGVLCEFASHQVEIGAPPDQARRVIEVSRVANEILRHYPRAELFHPVALAIVLVDGGPVIHFSERVAAMAAVSFCLYSSLRPMQRVLLEILGFEVQGKEKLPVVVDHNPLEPKAAAKI